MALRSSWTLAERYGRRRMSSPELEPDVHVVVVVHERYDSFARPRQAQVRADVDHARARGEEAVEQVLRERLVDLRRLVRAPLEPVQARVVDVGVEPVLVRAVAEA